MFRAATFWVPARAWNQPRPLTFFRHENSGRKLQSGLARRRHAGGCRDRRHRRVVGTGRCGEQKPAGLCLRRDIFVVGRRAFAVDRHRDVVFVVGCYGAFVGYCVGKETGSSGRSDPRPRDRPAVRAQYQSTGALSGMTFVGPCRRHIYLPARPQPTHCDSSPFLLCMGLFSIFCVWAPHGCLPFVTSPANRRLH